MENMGEYVESRDWGAEIGKIRKGDRVIINIISEPLQEKYNAIMLKREVFNERVEKLKALYTSPMDMSMEEAQEMHQINFDIERMRSEFWFELNTQYKLWKNAALAIRNGYCIVKTLSPQDFLDRLKGFMDEMGAELMGDEDGN